MNGPDLIPILKQKNIHNLYHANTVTTSCTFIESGGLASRGYVEQQGLKQTPQQSDATDKRFCIWHDVFLDTDDFHARMGSPNFYGPVLFVLDVEMLNALPPGTEVRVTKLNPYPKWTDDGTNGDRYFLTLADVAANLVKGRTDHIITLRTPNSILPFPATPMEVVLDDPGRGMQPPADTRDAYSVAEQGLGSAKTGSGVNVKLRKRICAPNCKCKAKYNERVDLRSRFDLV